MLCLFLFTNMSLKFEYNISNGVSTWSKFSGHTILLYAEVCFFPLQCIVKFVVVHMYNAVCTNILIYESIGPSKHKCL